MDKGTTDELHEALRPIASLISKSEKAQQKLAFGTWQHTILRDNLKALHIASALINKQTDDTDRVTRDDLQDALRAFASMIYSTRVRSGHHETTESSRRRAFLIRCGAPDGHWTRRSPVL